MSDTPSQELVLRWRSGSEDAATELYKRYAQRLIELAAARLRRHPKMASRVSPEDIAQSACRSFFTHIRKNDIYIEPGTGLWPLLACFTTRKLAKRVQFHTAKRRSIFQEQSIESPPVMGLSSLEFLSQEPGPAEAAALEEIRDMALSKFDPVPRQILELLLCDCGVSEICKIVGRTDRTIRYVRKKFEQRLWELNKD